MPEFENLKREVAEEIGLFLKDPTNATAGWIEVELIEDFSELPSDEVAELKTTHMKSGDTHTYQGGMAEPGTVGFKTQRAQDGAAGQVALRKLRSQKVPFPWLVVFPTGKTIEFQAFIKSYKSNVPLGELRVDEIILKRSGAAKDGVKGDYNGV